VKGRLTILAAVIPVLGLLALVGRAEYATRHGLTWTIPIQGYDPRDLLHGQYLQYRYRFQWYDVDTCGDPAAFDREPTQGCCLCLTPGHAGRYDPRVRQMHCDEAENVCGGTLRAESVMGPQRYFVPEDRALDLENALREREAAIELAIDPQGNAAVRELMLDRRPWRDAL
jgi:uncharacterized membrane-anchored protein